MDLPNTDSGKDQRCGLDVEQLCLACGTQMVEFDRLIEDGNDFHLVRVRARRLYRAVVAQEDTENAP